MRGKFARAIENQRARVQPFTELYLVNLLHGFLASEALYVQADDGSWQQKPLAFLLDKRRVPVHVRIADERGLLGLDADEIARYSAAGII